MKKEIYQLRLGECGQATSKQQWTLPSFENVNRVVYRVLKGF